MRLLNKECIEKYAAPPQVLETPWQWWHIRNVPVLPRGWACLRKTWPQWQSQIPWRRRETGSTPCQTSVQPSSTYSQSSFQTHLFAANFWQMKPPGIWVTMYPQKKEPWIIPTVSGSQSNWAFYEENKGCKNGNTLEWQLQGPGNGIGMINTELLSGYLPLQPACCLCR